MSEDFGEGVSRTLSAKARQFVNVVWQKGKPPLDSELNLMSQISEEARATLVRENVASGWIGDVFDPMSDFECSMSASNMFWMGKNVENTEGDILWANVNGWLVPVVGTLSTDTRNAIKLPPPQATVSDSDVNFVFLEVWQAQLSPDGSVNKPSASLLYKYGNTEYGGTNLTNDLLDPAILFETTERVQLQYRIRVVSGVNPSTSPFGFNAAIKGQGALDNPTTNANPLYQFTNMRDELDDPGLWRAGDGDGDAGELGTVDGYVYAIPIAMVFRRSSLAWNRSTQHGAVDRNPTMTDRSEAVVLPTIALTADIEPDTTTLLVDVAQSSTTFPATNGIIRIDGEIIEYSAWSGTTITVSARGAKATFATRHSIGDEVNHVSGHPMGLFSDQIVLDDIYDIRHMSSIDGLDYDGLLRANFYKLLKGELKTAWKKSVGEVKGKTNFQLDYFGATPDPNNMFTGDEPDGFRKIFSDASVLQPDNLLVCGTGNTVTSADFEFNPTATLSRQATTSWSTNDVVLLDLDQFRASFNTTNQNLCKIVHPFEYGDSTYDPLRLWFGDTDPAHTVPAQRTALTWALADANPHFVAVGTEPSELVISSSGTNDITFSGGDTISIPGIDWSTTQTPGNSVVEYLLATYPDGVYIVITQAGDAASVNPENHGIFKIDALSGTDVSVTRADGSGPAFSANTNNRAWSIRLTTSSETDTNMAIGLVHPDPWGAASTLYAGDVTLELAFALLYHPSRGMAKGVDKPLYVELDPEDETEFLRENDFQNIASSPSAVVKKSPIMPMVTYPHQGNSTLQVRDPQDITAGPESIWAEAYVDKGSKTLLYQPVRNIQRRLDPQDNPGTIAYSDVTNLFNVTTGVADASVVIPKEIRAPLGRVDVPFVASLASVGDPNSNAPA